MVAVAVTSTALTAELESQKSTARSVTIVVTPQNLSSEAPSWDFKTVLDTHSGDLSDDLVKSAALIDNGGGRYTPVAWVGAPPGGHHREGLLRFKPISPRPQSIELQITRSGEDTPLLFRWALK
jgi:hypothetical protein